MKLKMKHLFWVIAPCLFIFGGFSLLQDVSTTNANKVEIDSLSTRRQLRRSFFELREVLVIYGAENKALSEEYRTLLDSLARTSHNDSWRSMAIRFKEASQTKETDIRENILFLVGTAESNPVLKRMALNTPFELVPKLIEFNQKEYTSDDAVLSVSLYPNAENDTLPISFLTGNDESHIYDLFKRKVNNGGRSFFRQNMDYELYRNNTRMVLGDFDEEWKLDTSTFFDFSLGNDLVHSSKHFDFVDHQGTVLPDGISSLGSKIEQKTQTILDFFGANQELPKMSYHSYKNAEEKGLMTGNTDQAHFNLSDNSVHTVINEKYQDNFIEKENALLVQHLIGDSKTKALQRGLPIYFTDQWQREGYKHWSTRLYESGNALPLAELLNNEIVAVESALIVDCMSASLTDFLLETWGKVTFVKNY